MRTGKYIAPLLLYALCAMGHAPIGATTTGDSLDSLRHLLRNAQSDSAKVELYITISRQQHRGRHHELACVADADNAVKLAAQLDNTLLYAKSIDNLGLLYRYHQYYAEAYPLHKAAFDRVEHLSEVPPLSKMIYANNAGVAARHDGEYANAVKYYLKSLTIARQENDKRNMEIASSGIGIMLMGIDGREEEGLAYMRKALELAKEAGNTLGQAMHYLSIGSYHDDRGEYVQAREYFRELHALNTTMDDKNGLAITYQALGVSYAREGKDLRQAERHFVQAERYFTDLGNEIGLAHSLYSLGDIRYRNGQLTEAMPYFIKALGTGRTHNNKNLIQQSAERIAAIYEDQHDYAEAITYYKTAQSYKDSIARTEQETAVTALKRKYDFENKERAISLLTHEKLLKEAELDRRVLTIYLMAGVVILLLGLIFFLLRIRRLRKNTEMLTAKRKADKVRAEYEKSLMEAEMIATRMQINPHFMFNSLSAIKYMIQKNESDNAMKYLVIFSRFIRRVLETSERPIHTVAEELELLDNFLKLESNRFDTNFEYHIHDRVNQWADRPVMPAMLLHPFVENAIWHGLLLSDKPRKTLTITATSSHAAIHISIEDNGVGFMEGHTKVNGHNSMGHRITDRRVELYNKSFADRIDWQIEGLRDGCGNLDGTRVHLTIGVDSGVEQPEYTTVLDSLRLNTQKRGEEVSNYEWNNS